MRIYALLLAIGLLTAGTASAALILEYEASGIGSTPGGDPIYRFTYTLSGGSLLTDQELEIQFDPALYGPLSNASAPAGFDVLLFQPNNPPGTIGVYSALALIDNPALSPFLVDAVYLGGGFPPGQLLFINRYDDQGAIVEVIGPETAVSAIPEPATLTSVAVVLGLIGCAVRRRRRHTA